jgi:hypothetical protein
MRKGKKSAFLFSLGKHLKRYIIFAASLKSENSNKTHLAYKGTWDMYLATSLDYRMV